MFKPVFKFNIKINLVKKDILYIITLKKEGGRMREKLKKFFRGASAARLALWITDGDM